MRRLQMPMFTFMYADRDGNILHHFGGETPIRPRGDWRTWSGTVAGDSSTWLWTGIHPFDDLPTTVNPVSGWLQNANDPPWTTTFPVALEADDFPAYMAPRFMHLRAQRSARMIAEDESVTFDEAVGYKLSSRMELADRILDDLAVAVAEHGDEAARRAIDVLGAWDRAATAESRGAVLFVAFVQEMEAAGQSLETPHPATGFATAWSDDDPRATPDGLADPEAAAAALGRAAEAVEGRHGALDVAWGGVYRLRRNGHDHPAGGAPGSFGVFRVVNYMPGEDGVPTAGGGDSWISVVEFADPLRARVLLTYGNASQPGSPHNGDQLSLFAQDRLRTPWRTRREIERHLELREALEPPGREPQPKASSG
jgi:acyl-homoserine-lactone acylase